MKLKNALAAWGTTMLLLSAAPTQASKLKCGLAEATANADQFSQARTIELDFDRQAMHLYLDGHSTPNWSFITNAKPSVFDQRGDLFALRGDVTDAYGAGIRAGFPVIFYYREKTREALLTIAHFTDPMIVKWICAPPLRLQ